MCFGFSFKKKKSVWFRFVFVFITGKNCTRRKIFQSLDFVTKKRIKNPSETEMGED